MKKGSLFLDILQSVTRYFGVIITVVVIGILCSGIRVIQSGNQAIILRMGKIVGDTYEEQVHGPGLLLAFPYMIDEVIVIPADRVFEQSVVVHDSGSGTGKTSQTGYVMTGDNNIAVISASVKYTVSNPVRYALNVRDLPAVIDGCVSAAMVSEASSMRVDSLLTDEKDSYARAVLRRASEKLDAMDAGIRISSIELTKVAMPEEVREIYEQVNSATVQVSTMLGLARQYREKVIPEAQAAADTTVSAANADYAGRVAQANQDLAEFWGILEDYKVNPEGVKSRVYSEKVTEFLNKIGEVRVVTDGNTNLFLNPVPAEDAVPAESTAPAENTAPTENSAPAENTAPVEDTDGKP